MKRLSDAKIIEALRASKGYMAGAASILGCSRATVSRRIDNVPEVHAVYEEITESRLDRAESVLFEAVDAGKPWAIQYFLDAQGRARGYGKASGVPPDTGAEASVNFDALHAYFEGRAGELSQEDLEYARKFVDRTAKAGTLSMILEAWLNPGCEDAQKSLNAREGATTPEEESARYPFAL